MSIRRTDDEDRRVMSPSEILLAQADAAGVAVQAVFRRFLEDREGLAPYSLPEGSGPFWLESYPDGADFCNVMLRSISYELASYPDIVAEADVVREVRKVDGEVLRKDDGRSWRTLGEEQLLELADAMPQEDVTRLFSALEAVRADRSVRSLSPEAKRRLFFRAFQFERNASSRKCNFAFDDVKAVSELRRAGLVHSSGRRPGGPSM